MEISDQHLGKIFVRRDNSINEFDLRRENLTKYSYNTLNRQKLAYILSDNERLFTLIFPSTLYDSYFKESPKNVFYLAMRFALEYMQNNPESIECIFKTDDYEEMQNKESKNQNRLNHELLSLIYAFSKNYPREWMDIEDIFYNIDAKIADIENCVEILKQKALIISDPQRKYRHNRFQNGYISVDQYKINWEKENEISSILSQKNQGLSISPDVDISDEYIESLLKIGESSLFEVKGSFSINLKRAIDGDGTYEKSEDSIESTLKALVAFLNSPESEIRVLLLGIIENNKFKNIEKCWENEKFIKIDNNFSLVGIDCEFKRNGWDGFRLMLLDVINKRITPSPRIFIKIERHTYKNKEICIIKIGWFNSTPNYWFYLDGDKFIVRESGRCKDLKAQEADRYKKNQKWRES